MNGESGGRGGMAEEIAVKPKGKKGQALKPLTPNEQLCRDIKAAQEGDQQALDRALDQMKRDGKLKRAVECFTDHTDAILALHYEDKLFSKEMQRRWMAMQTAELLGSDPTPLERLLVDRVVH